MKRRAGAALRAFIALGIALGLALGIAGPACAAGTTMRRDEAIIAAAPASAWRDVPAEDLLLMDLGARGRVIIALAPDFAPVHVANIRALAHAGWWHDAHVVRVEDDYVAQWSGAGATAPRPAVLVAKPPAEYDRTRTGVAFRPLPYPDSYAAEAGFADDLPAARDGRSVWLTHCYGMVGVGRDMPPDTGDGTELYAVIGQAPRQLDRNVTLVGRVVSGMSALASLPRGTGELGFYADAGARIPIAGITLAADLPAAARPHVQVMRTDQPSFAAYLAARADRRETFFVRPLHGLDVCNAPVPVRISAR